MIIGTRRAITQYALIIDLKIKDGEVMLRILESYFKYGSSIK